MVNPMLPVVLGIVAPGVWRAAQLPANTVELIESSGSTPIVLNVGEAQTKSELLSAIGVAGQFPDYFGHNWDAVADCLNDLSWHGADGYVFVVFNGGQLAERDPAMTEILLDVLSEVSETWTANGVPFRTVWEGDIPDGIPSLEQL